MHYFPELVLNTDPSDLSLPSSWDYRCEPLVPGRDISFTSWTTLCLVVLAVTRGPSHEKLVYNTCRCPVALL
jgi:hypothetical protein